MNKYRVKYSIKNINCKKGDPAWNGGGYSVDANDKREASNKCKDRIRGEVLKRKELGPRTTIIIDSVEKLRKKR